MARILVVNPNSSRDVTASIDRNLDPVRASMSVDIDCMTLAGAPDAIESQADIEAVVQPLVALMQANPAEAYVTACFSDPGLALAREVLQAPVVGIAESAMLMALGLGYRFGIIAILDVSVRRHLRYVRSLGLEGRLAGDRPINLGVHESGDNSAVERILEVGKTLRDVDGADVLILGCTGMAHRRELIEKELGLPVIDPTQAAVVRAAGLISLGYRRAA